MFCCTGMLKCRVAQCRYETELDKPRMPHPVEGPNPCPMGPTRAKLHEGPTPVQWANKLENKEKIKKFRVFSDLKKFHFSKSSGT